jgi:hypothetical protein
MMEMTFFGKKNKDPRNGRGRERRWLKGAEVLI